MQPVKIIQVRNVKDETHAALRRRAGAAGISLQEYLARELDELVARPTLEEVLERAGSRSGGRVGLAEAAQQLRAEREAR